MTTMRCSTICQPRLLSRRRKWRNLRQSIFIPDVTNIKALVNSIAGVLGKDVEFHLIRQATTTFAWWPRRRKASPPWRTSWPSPIKGFKPSSPRRKRLQSSHQRSSLLNGPRGNSGWAKPSRTQGQRLLQPHPEKYQKASQHIFCQSRAGQEQQGGL